MCPKKKSGKLKASLPDFMDAHMVLDENLSEHLNRLIGDHKKLFDQYAAYTREHDKLYSKYVLMIEALKQEHQMLKLRLRCDDSDPLEAKKTNLIKENIKKMLDEEACVVTQISLVLQQLSRDQLFIDKHSKIIMEKKEGLRACMNEVEERKHRERFIIELEHKKYMCTVHLNESVDENQKLRTTIDKIKMTRNRYETSFKALLKQIQEIKEVKRVLLEEAQQFIEDKETTNSMINGMLSGNKKESALYQQKIESMKQMIRYDTKATDFLVRKLNERSELKAIDQVKRTEELKEILNTAVKHLDKLKEEQDAIQDVTEEKDGQMITKVYMQKEADKMALFNYIADLNGELIHLKQQQQSLLSEIESLKTEGLNITKDFEATMARNESNYERLLREDEECQQKSYEVHSTMEAIKEFIHCTFKLMNCSTQTMEENLGLDLEVNPRNMSAYLREIENETSNMLQSLQYAEQLGLFEQRASVVDEVAMAVFKEQIKSQELPLMQVVEDSPVHNMKVDTRLIPNPTKDFPEYSNKTSTDTAISSKKSLAMAATMNIKDRLETSLSKKFK